MKISYLYIIGSKDGPYKMGFSVNPNRRLKQLQTGHSLDLLVHYIKEVDRALVKYLEYLLHKEIGRFKIRGEWYDMPLDQAIVEIEYIIIRYESYGIELKNIIKRGY